MTAHLTTAQQSALAYVHERSTGGQLDASVSLTLNFHPDVVSAGRSVLQAWADEPVYRSQFLTGTSNGGLTAVPDGSRWQWESQMFGGAYDDAEPAERSVYGALNLFSYPYGAAVRFGSAHLVLDPALLERTTLCYPDSTHESQAVGTAQHAGVVSLARCGMPDRLDDYVEAQIHGPVHLSDAAGLVLDPSFRGTAVAAAAEILAERGLPVRWHAGFGLSVDRLHELRAYRGPEVVTLGRALARELLTPARLGLTRGDPSVDPQLSKQLWHCLARFGYLGPTT